MEEALVTRLRSALTGVAGTVNARPAVDWVERQSDVSAAFPACVLTVVSPGKTYDHDGADGLQTRRVRAECFGITYSSAKALARAIISSLEISATVAGVRFGRGRLEFERDFQPEDLGGGLKVHRVILDFYLPTKPV